jgi:hypothetical protein
LAKSPVTIGSLLNEIRSYFDEEEISGNPQAYQQLIIDTIRQLLYLRIIVVCATA